jgi:PAS domain S-box-containing protein
LPMIADELSELARGIGQAIDDNDVVHMLASLVAASHEFIGVADLEGNALFVNEAGRRLVGLRDLQAVRSTRIIDYFAPDDQPKVLQEVLPAVRATGFWQGELKFRNFATGELVPVLYSIFPVRDSSGAISAYGTITRNLTETRRAEQQLRSLASIVESSDDAIVSKNLDCVIMSWNSGAERIFGYSAQEAVGQPITIVIPEDRQDEEREILARVRRGERVDHFETIRQRKDGSPIVISLTVSPVKNNEGKIVAHQKSRETLPSRSGRRSKSSLWLGRQSTAARMSLRTCRPSSPFPRPTRLTASSVQSKDASARLRLFTRCLPKRVGAVQTCRQSRRVSLRLILHRAKGAYRYTSATPVGARCRTGHSTDPARVGDQRRQVWSPFCSRRPDRFEMVA